MLYNVQQRRLKPNDYWGLFNEDWQRIKSGDHDVKAGLFPKDFSYREACDRGAIDEVAKYYSTRITTSYRDSKAPFPMFSEYIVTEHLQWGTFLNDYLCIRKDVVDTFLKNKKLWRIHLLHGYPRSRGVTVGENLKFKLDESTIAYHPVSNHCTESINHYSKYWKMYLKYGEKMLDIEETK